MTLDLRDRILDVPDFPTEGIVFKDVMPLLGDAAYFAEAIRQLADWSRPREPDLILGAEARGFIFGGALAYELGAGFVAARKPGKLPRETVEATYALEYGTDSLQVHRDAVSEGARVIVLDDVLATGGTAKAKTDLVEGSRWRRRRCAVRARAHLPRGARATRGVRRSLADPVLARPSSVGRPRRSGSAASDRRTTTRACTTR